MSQFAVPAEWDALPAVSGADRLLERLFALCATASFALSIAGYQVLSFFLNPDQTRAGSVPFRIGMVVLQIATATLAVLVCRRRVPISAALAVLFVVIYTLRFAHDTIFRPIEIFNPPLDDAILFYFGICLPTFFGLILVRDKDAIRRAGDWLFWMVYFICAAGMITGAGLIARGQNKLESGATYLLGNGAMNHFQFAHMGLLLLGLGAYKVGCRRYRNRLSMILMIASIPLAVAVMLLADSRSAFVGAPLVIIAALYGAVRARNLAVIVVSIVIATVSASWLIGYADYVNLDLAKELTVWEYLGGESTYNREAMGTRAVEEFEAHPLLGDEIVEETYGEYPHNILIEAFMATGFFGGFLYLLLWVRGAYIAWRFVGDEEFGWLAVVFLDQMALYLASGALFISSDVWALFAIVVGLDMTGVSRRRGGWEEPYAKRAVVAAG
jgi:hypothetical protein